MILLTTLMAACGTASDDAERAADHLLRASILLRSRPPAESEVRAVRADPDALTALIRSWSTETPELGALVRDLHAQDLYVRFDTQGKPPPRGPLEGVPGARIAESLDEAPLRLIEHIVLHDRPYTEIVTADYAVVDQIAARAFGPAYDPGGPEWQPQPWPDGRPAAGVLSSTSLWMRHPSGNLNHHRTRAALVARALLCDDMTARAAAGSLDPHRQEEAVRTDENCVACHAVLDPLASSFWGFRPYILPQQISAAYGQGCATGNCYPLELWDPEAQPDPHALGMPAPALYGQRVEGLAEVGQRIAEDPRFATCAVRRFWSYLARIPVADVPADLVRELTDAFVRSNYDAGELLLEIVAHPSFAPDSEAAPAAAIRPQQLVRTVLHLTGFRWGARPSPGWGAVDLGLTDRFGFQALMGGLDGWRVVGLDPGALPTRELALDWLTEEAALFAVEADLARPLERRTWLTEGVPTGGAAARRQLAAWRLRVLGQVVSPRSPEIDRDLEFLEELLQAHGSAPRAWTLLLAAYLQHPRLMVL